MRATRWSAGIATLLVATSCRETVENDAPTIRVSVSAPPIDIALPQFALVDHTGAPFTTESMKGSVFVVDFMFTSCPRVCPELTKTMATFSKTVRDKPGVKFLSVTVDPETDTPQRLAEFRDKYADRDAPWFFVTGDPKMVDDTVLKGFKMAMSRGTDGGHGEASIFHAERFVVIDKRTHLRGIFDTTQEGLARLQKTIDQLLVE